MKLPEITVEALNSVVYPKFPEASRHLLLHQF